MSSAQQTEPLVLIAQRIAMGEVPPGTHTGEGLFGPMEISELRVLNRIDDTGNLESQLLFKEAYCESDEPCLVIFLLLL